MPYTFSGARLHCDDKQKQISGLQFSYGNQAGNTTAAILTSVLDKQLLEISDVFKRIVAMLCCSYVYIH